MNFEELEAQLAKLVGQRLTFKRVAGDSIFLYFFGEPGDPSVVGIELDPAWRYEHQRKIVVGSMDLSLWESDAKSQEDYHRQFDRMCRLSDGLIGSVLLSLSLDLSSSDLALHFSQEQVLRKFANSAFDEIAWVYRSHPADLVANVSPRGIQELRLSSLKMSEDLRRDPSD